jgi:hypothetical protein
MRVKLTGGYALFLEYRKMHSNVVDIWGGYNPLNWGVFILDICPI